MNLWLFIPGVLITCITFYDIIYTTFAPSGPSLISGRVTIYTWKMITAISKITGNRSMINGGGVVIICTILVTWVALIWVGNVLIFSSDPMAVVDSGTNQPADISERFYYAGYVISTLGNGDFSANSARWEIYTSILSFFGLIIITIAVTYMVPVLSAVTNRRTLSIEIASLGHSPQKILLNHWDGENFKQLEDNLNLFKEKIALQGQLHLSYPILQYFQNSQKLTALLPNLVALDEALTILHYMVPEKMRPGSTVMEPMRIIVASFFHSLASTAKVKAASDVPGIDTQDLVKAGIPLLSPSTETLQAIHDRRLLLKDILQNSGWHWNEIYNELETTRFS